MAISLTAIVTNSTCNGALNGSITIVPTGGTVPYSYVWTKNGEFYSTDKNIYFLGAASYKIVVTDSAATPLTYNNTYAVTEPDAVTATFTVTPVQCAGTTGIITAVGHGGTSPYTYKWNTGETSSAIIKVSGTYTVVVTDNNGCTGTNTFFLADTTPVTIEIEQELEQCYEESIVLKANVRGGTAPYTVLWSPNGETTLAINAVNSTLYSVTATDANGCTGTTQIYVPTQLEAWQCCLGHQYAKQAQTLIKGNDVGDEWKTNTAILSLAIEATTRFSRQCLSAEQQQTIKDYINQTCGCGCGNIAAQQQL